MKYIFLLVTCLVTLCSCRDNPIVKDDIPYCIMQEVDPFMNNPNVLYKCIEYNNYNYILHKEIDSRVVHIDKYYMRGGEMRTFAIIFGILFIITLLLCVFTSEISLNEVAKDF